MTTVIMTRNHLPALIYLDKPDRAIARVNSLNHLHSCGSTYYQDLDTHIVNANEYYKNSSGPNSERSPGEPIHAAIQTPVHIMSEEQINA